MIEPGQEHYGLEPQRAADSDSDQARSATGQPQIERRGEPHPVPLEHPDTVEPETARPGSVKDLDVCPNCGASMRQSDALVCLRCGFDLKTNRLIKTRVKKPAEDAAESADGQRAERAPLVVAGRGDIWLPAALAIGAGAVMLVAYLAGARGLFPRIEAPEPPPWDLRLLRILQSVVLAALWTGCGTGALFFLGNLLGRRLGDLRLAAMRMLGIVVTLRLVTLLSLSPAWLEWLLEAIAQAGLFVLLSIAFFSVKPRDAVTLAAATVILILTVWLGAFVIVWVGGAA